MSISKMSETGQLEVITSSTSSTFTWKIENFSTRCSKFGEYISSPLFEFGEYNKKTYSKWTLKMYPFGYNEKSEDYISIALTFKPQTLSDEFVCSYEVSINDVNKNGTSTKKTSKIERFTSKNKSWGWAKFRKRSGLFDANNTSLQLDTLIISCSICDAPFKALSHSTCLLTDTYKCIYLSGDFSDVTIVIDNKKINAHKAILSARSKVFSAMFRNDMAEANGNLITISDVEYTVINQFLLFIYCGKVDDIDKFAISLLPIADKYDVDDLKSLCETTLLKSLRTDNACELLSIADLNNCIKLRTETIEFIALHTKEIIKTEGFEDLLSSNQVLFKEVFCKVVEMNCI